MARLEMMADPDGSMEQLSAVRTEALGLGFAHWAIEAALYLAVALNSKGEHASALEEAEKVGSDIDVYGAMRSRVRAAALLGLGRVDEAATEVDGGIGFAEERGLLYEKALLLLLKADVALADGTDTRPALEEAGRLLQSLGIAGPG
jgi:hypothetical protein